MNEDRQKLIKDYLTWAYADPKYQEFTTKLVIEYLDTGKKPDVKKRFEEYLDDRHPRK